MSASGPSLPLVLLGMCATCVIGATPMLLMADCHSIIHGCIMVVSAVL